jgi:hypothetical protein
LFVKMGMCSTAAGILKSRWTDVNSKTAVNVLAHCMVACEYTTSEAPARRYSADRLISMKLRIARICRVQARAS